MYVSLSGYCVYTVSQCLLYGYVNSGLVSVVTTSDANYLGWTVTYATMSMIVPPGGYYSVYESFPGYTGVTNWTELN